MDVFQCPLHTRDARSITEDLSSDAAALRPRTLGSLRNLLWWPLKVSLTYVTPRFSCSQDIIQAGSQSRQCHKGKVKTSSV